MAQLPAWGDAESTSSGNPIRDRRLVWTWLEGHGTRRLAAARGCGGSGLRTEMARHVGSPSELGLLPTSKMATLSGLRSAFAHAGSPACPSSADLKPSSTLAMPLRMLTVPSHSQATAQFNVHESRTLKRHRHLCRLAICNRHGFMP